MRPYNIVLTDDHVMFRLGLRRIIERFSGLQVIGEAGDGLELLNLLKTQRPDLVVLDISMPGMRGLETIHEMKAIYADVRILILTVHREMEYVTAAISAGANGYLLKEDSDKQLFSAIEKIREGGIYVSPKLADNIARDWSQACRKDRSPLPKEEPLTIREREVLKLTVEGKSSKEIADILCISHRTVEHHRAHMMTKLNVRRAIDLVTYALSKKYL